MTATRPETEPATATALDDALRRLPGMRDLTESEHARMRRTQDGMQRTLALHGYRVVETPVLEPTELFLRKSGGELASRMYTFTEPGGRRVSLRPEYTSAVIRLFLSEQRREPLPLRYQYAGPVFRYDPASPTRQREFHQVGAELIGASGPEADAEVLSLACQLLTLQGLADLRLSIGDVGAVHALLDQFGLSERAQLLLLAGVGDMRDGNAGVARVKQRAEAMGLFRQTEDGAEPGARAATLPHRLLMPTLQNPVGVRTREEILDRLSRKLQAGDTPELVQRALEFTAQLALVRGDPGPALTEAKTLAKRHGLDPAPLDSVQKTLTVLELHGLKSVETLLDMGLARGLAYYTGIVFEIRRPSSPRDASLGGGGRYDGLLKALGGGRGVSALGFACSTERVLEALGPADPGDRPLRRVLVAPRSPEAYGPALKVAAALRLGGEAAEVTASPTALPAGRELARGKNMDALVLVEADGSSQREPI